MWIPTCLRGDELSDTVVIGCGGAGCIIASTVRKNYGIPVVRINSDSREEAELEITDVNVQGCFGDSDLGWALATDRVDKIRELLEGHTNVISIAGLGGGTGVGVMKVLAECARSMNVRSISIVSLPFVSDKGRRETAYRQFREISKLSDYTVVIDMNRIASIGFPDIRFTEVLETVNDTMALAVHHLRDMLAGPFRSLMSSKVYSIARATSSNPTDCAERALAACFYPADVGTAKIVIVSDSSLNLDDREAIALAVCNRTGILPEVVSESGEGQGLLLFIPISFRSE